MASQFPLSHSRKSDDACQIWGLLLVRWACTAVRCHPLPGVERALQAGLEVLGEQETFVSQLEKGLTRGTLLPWCGDLYTLQPQADTVQCHYWRDV